MIDMTAEQICDLLTQLNLRESQLIQITHISSEIYFSMRTGYLFRLVTHDGDIYTYNGKSKKKCIEFIKYILPNFKDSTGLIVKLQVKVLKEIL
jgi:hypothetical protein